MDPPDLRAGPRPLSCVPGGARPGRAAWVAFGHARSRWPRRGRPGRPRAAALPRPTALAAAARAGPRAAAHRPRPDGARRAGVGDRGELPRRAEPGPGAAAGPRGRDAGHGRGADQLPGSAHPADQRPARHPGRRGGPAPAGAAGLAHAGPADHRARRRSWRPRPHRAPGRRSGPDPARGAVRRARHPRAQRLDRDPSGGQRQGHPAAGDPGRRAGRLREVRVEPHHQRVRRQRGRRARVAGRRTGPCPRPHAADPRHLARPALPGLLPPAGQQPGGARQCGGAAGRRAGRPVPAHRSRSHGHDRPLPGPAGQDVAPGLGPADPRAGRAGLRPRSGDWSSDLSPSRSRAAGTAT